jgi:hypothetical protein
MRYNRHEDLITVRGILVPVEWDESGSVLTTAVSTDKEDEFVIDNNNKGQELRVHLRARIEVTGSVRESEGRMIISVKNFALLRIFDQPES